MNIKATIALTALVLSAALTAPAFAQSGTITFKGRIVAPICSGTPVAEQANPAAPSPAFSMDNSGCEHSAGLVASTRMTHDVAPTQTLVRPQQNGTEQAAAEPVLTITYH